jgi:hypothetical protein
MKPKVYLVPPALFVPLLLTVAVVVMAFRVSWLALLALPFVWLGSICAQPNLNLANGCLAYLAILVGIILVGFHVATGIPILFGTLAGFYLSAAEKWIRARPLPESRDDPS